jgi:hypothetical protein
MEMYIYYVNIDYSLLRISMPESLNWQRYIERMQPLLNVDKNCDRSHTQETGFKQQIALQHTSATLTRLYE